MSETRQQKRKDMKRKMQPRISMLRGSRIRPIEPVEATQLPFAMRCCPRPLQRSGAE